MERLRLVKLLFLACQERTAPSDLLYYGFLPYRYGPFSFTMYHEIGRLEENGFLNATEQHFRISPSGIAEASKVTGSPAIELDALCKRFASWATRALVALVYKNYPWFTVNSVSEKNRLAEKPVAVSAIYTVGYEAFSVDHLLNLCLKKGISRLIDVRKNPVARRFGYHKSTLKRLCSDVGLSYTHFPELGVPSEWRQNLSEHSAYIRVFARYEREVLAKRLADVVNVERLMRTEPCVLLCVEADPELCHRTRLARFLAGRTGMPTMDLRAA